jgi:hypothetical protein
MAALRLQRAWLQLRIEQHKAYNPNQPRVPAGNSDGGQWTNGGEGRIRLASADKPQLGAGTLAVIASEVARRVIEVYRSENGLKDLFGRNQGTVAFTTINGSNVFGSNSNSPTYTTTDRGAAERLRDILMEKYPEVMDAGNVGGMPKNALFHAETTVLLRAARANHGTLEGQTLEVRVDNAMCNNCRRILPYVGLELGNPTVTFLGPKGRIHRMRNGSWVDGDK